MELKNYDGEAYIVKEGDTPRRIITRDNEMLKMLRLVDILADEEISVLITGET